MIVTDGYKPPFRVGRKLQRAVVDSNGREVQTFKPGFEDLAKIVCDLLNGRYVLNSERESILKSLPEKIGTDECLVIRKKADRWLITYTDQMIYGIHSCCCNPVFINTDIEQAALEAMKWLITKSKISE